MLAMQRYRTPIGILPASRIGWPPQATAVKTSLSGRQLMAELTPPTLPTLVQRFFLDHLGEQRAVSAQTVAAYRDTLRLLLNYAAAALRRTPSAITLPDLDAPLLLAFLDHLRSEEHTSALQSLMRISYAVFC